MQIKVGDLKKSNTENQKVRSYQMILKTIDNLWAKTLKV